MREPRIRDGKGGFIAMSLAPVESLRLAVAGKINWIPSPEVPGDFVDVPFCQMYAGILLRERGL